MNDLKARGFKDILIAVVDGLSGFPEAIETAYPRTLVQTRIVHLIRNSMAYGSWKERKRIAAALKAIYQAENADAALAALEAFETGEWGRKSHHRQELAAAMGAGHSLHRLLGTDPQSDLHDQCR